MEIMIHKRMFSIMHKRLDHKFIQLLQRFNDSHDYGPIIDYFRDNLESIKKYYNKNIADILYNYLKFNDIPEELRNLIYSVDPENKIFDTIKLKGFIKNDDFNSFIDYLGSKRELINDDYIASLLNNFLDKRPEFDCVYYLIYFGKYSADLINEYLQKFYNYDDFRKLVDLIIELYGKDYAMDAINNCISINNDIRCMYLLGDLLLETGQKEKLIPLVNKIISLNPKKPNMRIARYLFYTGNYKQSIDYMILSDNTNQMLADAYYYSGNYENALIIYKNIYYNINKNVINRIIEIEYKIGDYASTLTYINYNKNNLSREQLIYKINSEINLLMFFEAEDDIKEYQKQYGTDNDILKQMLIYYRKNGDIDLEFETALNLVKNNSADDFVYRTILNYYYKNGENEKIINFMEKQNIMERYPEYYIPALIYTNKFDAGLAQINKNPSILGNGKVIDTIFLFSRNNRFLEFFEKYKYDYELLSLIIDFLKGRKIKDPFSYIKSVINSGSISCAYIISLITINFEKHSIPKKINDMLDMDKFRDIKILIENIMDIYSGIIDTAEHDSKYFIYPVTETLIRSGRMDQALSLLGSMDGFDNDPFINYFMALIKYYKKEYSDAKRYINYAIEKLDNEKFMAVKFLIYLIDKNSDMVDIANTISDKDMSCVYQYVYDMILQANIVPNEDIYARLKNLNIDDINLLRIKRYFANNFKDRIQYSALILKNGLNVSDVIKHYYIIYEENPDNAARFLLKTGLVNYKIYSILGDYYFSKKMYNEAIFNYLMAYIRKPEANLINLKTLLESVDIYGNSIDYLKSIGNYFLLSVLYIVKGDLIPLGDLLVEKKLRRIYSFAILKDFDSPVIMNALKDVFNETHDNVIGELIADGFIHNENYDEAEKTLKIVYYYNRNSQAILLKLAHAEYLNNNEEESMYLLKSGFRRFKSIYLFNLLIDFYYSIRNYEGILNISKKFQNLINSNNIKYILYSYARLFMYNDLYLMETKYQGMINHEVKSELKNRKIASLKFKNVIEYAKLILKKEYDNNKIIDRELATSIIPEYFINEVYDFLESREPYTFIDKYKYNQMSIEVLRAIRNMGIKNIHEIKIYHINHILNDVIKSKNFYIFLNWAMNNEININISKAALAMYKDLENKPGSIMDIVSRFNIGVLDAINILDSVNREIKNDV
jgi:hypothetical protein